MYKKKKIISYIIIGTLIILISVITLLFLNVHEHKDESNSLLLVKDKCKKIKTTSNCEKTCRSKNYFTGYCLSIFPNYTKIVSSYYVYSDFLCEQKYIDYTCGCGCPCYCITEENDYFIKEYNQFCVDKNITIPLSLSHVKYCYEDCCSGEIKNMKNCFHNCFMMD